MREHELRELCEQLYNQEMSIDEAVEELECEIEFDSEEWYTEEDE